MPKIFDRTNEELGFGVKRINENIWFKHQQGLLLRMANTDYGRDLLCIPKGFPKIYRIEKNSITTILDAQMGLLKTDFRIGAKWANVIRYRWKEFQEYASYFYEGNPLKLPILLPVAPLTKYRNDTLTVYPDPSPETTTVDGEANQNTETTWDAARDGAGDAASDSTSSVNTSQVYKDASPRFDIARGFFLFDTSALGSGATISAAVMSLVLSAKVNNENDGLDYIVTTLTAPASNTAIVAGDYDSIAGLTGAMTAQSNTVDIGTLTADSTTYNDLTMNATGRSNVSKTGVTKFGIAEGHDAEDTALSDAGTIENSTRTLMAEASGTSTDPKLVITYTPGSAVTKRLLGILGVGQ